MTEEQIQRLKDLTDQGEQDLRVFHDVFSEAIKKYSDYLNTRARISNLMRQAKEMENQPELFNQNP